jgi:multidrug resistance efflux pump
MENPPSSPASAAPAPAPKKRPRIARSQVFLILGVLTLVAVVAGAWYLREQQKYVFSDKADVEAPLISLAPLTPGDLKTVYVKQGDWLAPNQIVARVGDDVIRTRVGGVAVTVKQDLGAHYQPGQAVVTMIEPRALRVVARISEDKGLSQVYEGQKVRFTVDAFGSRSYDGTVENVSETSHEGDVVFNISDKREEKEFEVKVAFDTNDHAELQNGMSARVWIIK